LNQADGDEDIEDAEAADDATKGSVEKKHSQGLRKVSEEIVALPIVGPREIEKERAHLQAEDNQNDAKRFVHERRSVWPRETAVSE
jgi:hypothetical protein